mmetsp:Transcript_7400/g.21678  ORF Transcript_7400/g.21678 Transcript_7400/m.21678 type:complete len:225 (+) Transcript_7400:1916-2590(+)
MRNPAVVVEVLANPATSLRFQQAVAASSQQSEVPIFNGRHHLRNDAFRRSPVAMVDRVLHVDCHLPSLVGHRHGLGLISHPTRSRHRRQHHDQQQQQHRRFVVRSDIQHSAEFNDTAVAATVHRATDTRLHPTHTALETNPITRKTFVQNGSILLEDMHIQCTDEIHMDAMLHPGIPFFISYQVRHSIQRYQQLLWCPTPSRRNCTSCMLGIFVYGKRNDTYDG